MFKKVISLAIISALSVSLPVLACDESDKPHKEGSVKSNHMHSMHGQKTVSTVIKGGQVFNVQGMTCKGCVDKVKKAITNVKGVKSVNVDLKANKATVVLLPNANTKAVNTAIAKAVEKSGFKADIVVSKKS